MSIKVTVHANDDDALIAWTAKDWDPKWVGFMVEKRNSRTEEVT